MDVFTIDMDNTMNLEARLCGDKLPDPILSIHQRLELVFKSDYAASRRGFFGRYEFLDERTYMIMSVVHGSDCMYSVCQSLLNLMFVVVCTLSSLFGCDCG